MKTSNKASIIALAISIGWGILLGVSIIRNTRQGVWYDMDFSIWVICFFYGLIHLVIGKIWCFGVSFLVNTLERNTIYQFQQHWTEDFQIIFGSLWPVSVPLSVLVFVILMLFGKKKKDHCSML